VLGLDHYAPFLLSAFGITLVVLVGYVLYLHSRMQGLQRRAAAIALSEQQAYSGRNVTAAAPRATTAHAASSANGPSSA
jgi:heme exporter protein D